MGQIIQENLADAKVSTRQQCMYEDSLRKNWSSSTPPLPVNIT